MQLDGIRQVVAAAVRTLALIRTSQMYSMMKIIIRCVIVTLD